ncbi:DNA-binding protein [Ktedonosporobacter rubrisoli]|uniref:DNA-binding protein n=1 Tax=Ktedonosporobacter rubrisoli TaxID=2509675 RepID=A0A4P6JJI5_KTERU|nr:helix-turn-helix domain-containing protein [Ktedonosporobacter rubrisoli]QBD75090.1 DNA-binding protein [Ktedonosporobacter rubrisoli]
MSENAGHPELPGYVSIRGAAKLLGISEKTVYHYVDQGRLPAMWAANVLMISIEDVQKFQRGPSGRPRKNTPPWRLPTGDNTQFMTMIQVQIRSQQHEALVKKLEQIKKGERHIFPGTAIRSIMHSETEPDQLVIVLSWRKAVMPDQAERETALEAFRRELADVLDWSTARYNSGSVLMHTS